MVADRGPEPFHRNTFEIFCLLPHSPLLDTVYRLCVHLKEALSSRRRYTEPHNLFCRGNVAGQPGS